MVTYNSSYITNIIGGFTKIIDHGYDDEHDIYYIAMNKLDADLNTLIQNGQHGRL